MTTFAGQWGPEEFIDKRGNAMPNVVVSIFDSTGVALVQLYADRARAAQLANPLPIGVAEGVGGLDARANGLFWADPDRYVMVVLSDGVEVYRKPITVNVDPAEQTDVDAAAIAAHIGSTTNVHGIPDTSLLVNAAQLAQEAADRAAGDAALAAAALANDALVVHKAGAETITGPKTFSVGGQSITAEAAGVVPLYVKGAAAQTADLFQARDSTGAVLAMITAAGAISGTALVVGGTTVDVPNLAYLNVANVFTQNQRINAGLGVNAAPPSIGKILAGTGIDSSGYVQAAQWVGARGGAVYIGDSATPNNLFPSASAAHVVVAIKLAAAQTADGWQLQSSAAAVLARVSSAGWGSFGHASSPGAAIDARTTTGSPAGYFNATTDHGIEAHSLGVAGRAAVRARAESTTAHAIFATGLASNSQPVVIVRLGATPGADALQVQDSAAVVLAKVRTDGAIFAPFFQSNATNGSYIGYPSGSPTSQLVAQLSTYVALVVKGFAAQSANLLELQDSTGALLVYVEPPGDIVAKGLSVLSTATSTSFGAAAAIRAGVASHVGLIVRGFAAQSASLLELQKSDGVVLMKIEETTGATSGLRRGEVTVFGSGSNTGGLLRIRTPGTVVFDFDADTGVASFNSAVSARLEPLTAASIGLVVRGKAAQTGDLFRLQDSAAVVLASIAADGKITAPTVVAATFSIDGNANKGLKQGASNNITRLSAFTHNEFYVWDGVSAYAEVARIAIGGLTLAEAKNIALGTVTGTKIGTGPTERLALYGGTPVVQGAAIADVAAAVGAPTQAEFNALVTAFNTLLARLRPTTGIALIAA